MGDENKVAKRKKSMVKAKLIALIAVIVIALGAGLYFGKSLSSESRITKLGFEDMGELATQAAYCTMVEDTEAARDLFGVEIPFTQSRLIYSYDVIVRAGLDFEQIEWSVDEPNKGRCSTANWTRNRSNSILRTKVFSEGSRWRKITIP